MMIVYTVAGTLVNLIELVMLHVTNAAHDACEDSPFFKDHPSMDTDDCVDYIKRSGTIYILIAWLIWLGFNLWFLLNIRDWRDALKDEKPETDVHAPVAVEMQQ